MFESTILKISGVRKCAMIGIYNNEISDEDIYLVVEKEDKRSDEEFKKYLIGQLVTGPNSIDLYAQPDQIIFMEIPVSGRSQKVDKNKIKDMITNKS